MKRGAAVFCLLWFIRIPAPLRAQLNADPLPPSSAPLLQEQRAKAEPKPLLPAPAARAIALAFGPETWTKVRISTEGPVADLGKLAASGHYKLEIIQLVLLAARSGLPLKDLAEERDKGKGVSLKELAERHGQDYDKLYDAALALEDVVDREYLPLFPQPRIRKE